MRTDTPSDPFNRPVRLHALPVSPIREVLTRIAALKTGPASATSPDDQNQDARLDSLERLILRRDDVHSRPSRGALVLLNPALWVELEHREARSAAALVAGWERESRTAHRTRRALLRDVERMRTQALIISRLPFRSEVHTLLASALQRLERCAQPEHAVGAAAIRTAVLALDDHIIIPDPQGGRTAGTYRMTTTGTRLIPDLGPGAAENHAGLVELLTQLHAATATPLPTFPGAPGPAVKSGQTAQIQEHWTDLLARALAAAEERVRQEINEQDRIWNWAGQKQANVQRKIRRALCLAVGRGLRVEESDVHFSETTDFSTSRMHFFLMLASMVGTSPEDPEQFEYVSVQDALLTAMRARQADAAPLRTPSQQAVDGLRRAVRTLRQTYNVPDFEIANDHAPA